MNGASPPPILLSSPLPRRKPPLLLGIVALALALRLLDLGGLPPSLFRDEAEKALTAYSLLINGTDLEGRPWPLFVRAFGVTTSAIYQYAAIPGIAVFGPTDFAARLPAALAGMLTVALLPWAFARVAPRPVLLVAALALALSPWHLPFSRWAQQGIFLPLLFLVSYGCLSRLDPPRGKATVALGMLAGGAAGLAIYAYDPARLVVPMVGLAYLALHWRGTASRPLPLAGAALLFLVVSAPTLAQLATATEATLARFRAISVFSLPAAEILPRILANYLSHFSPRFLVLSGDSELRHGAGGVLGWVLGPALGLGLLTSLRPGARRRRGLLVAVVLCSPASAALTREGVPHALRTLCGAPFFIALATLGLFDAWHWIRRRFVRRLVPGPVSAAAVSGAAAALIALASMPFLYTYFGTYARNSAFNWQYGVREALAQLRPIREGGVTIQGCMVVGGGMIASWHDLQNRRTRETPWPAIERPLVESPFGASPADLAASAPDGVPLAFVALPGLAPLPGGVLLPVWYQGRGSADGKNPTLVEIHLNRPALEIFKKPPAQ